MSGVWIRARKLEGELDVGGRRILCPTGESMSRCGTSRVLDRARVWPPCEEEVRIRRICRGRVVSLLFEIVSQKGNAVVEVRDPKGNRHLTLKPSPRSRRRGKEYRIFSWSGWRGLGPFGKGRMIQCRSTGGIGGVVSGGSDGRPFQGNVDRSKGQLIAQRAKGPNGGTDKVRASVPGGFSFGWQPLSLITPHRAS